MLRFAAASDDELARLVEDARRACVVFGDITYPPGTQPAHGRLGFETAPNGTVTVLVDRVQTSWPGPLADWLHRGHLQLRDTARLAAFFRGPVADAFHTDETVTVDAAAVLAQRSASIRGQVDADRLARHLARGVCGQPAALHTLAGAVARHLSKFQPARPLSIMLAGPTGVGKTTAATLLPQAIAAASPDRARPAFLRVNCGELTQPHQVARLLGAPPGYVGHEQGSELADILRQPAVVLFDEIDKAHPDILGRVLLNLIDEGQLTAPSRQDSQPALVEARASMLLFTTNLDAGGLVRRLERLPHPRTPLAVNHACRTHLLDAGLRPELVGRLSTFAVFGPLTATDTVHAATVALHDIAGEYGLRLAHIHPAVVATVLDAADSRRLGVRAIRHIIDEQVGPALAASAGAGGTIALTIDGDTVRALPYADPTRAGS